MRLRVVLLSMALGVVVAGNARAYDGTGVIYDLSTLRTQPASKPGHEGPADHDGIGVKTPHDRRDWGHEHGNDNGRHNGWGHGHGEGTGMPRAWRSGSRVAI
jgi:hypothetical protein